MKVLSLAEIQKKLPSTCQIVAVSKLQTTWKIQQLAKLGQKHFAENYVQEANKKLTELSSLALHWHFIGALQKNKVKDVVGKFEYIHSVDEYGLAEMIQKQAEKKNLIQKIFIQLNLAEESTKGGIRKEELPVLFEKISKLANVHVIGLMTMPPLFNDPEKSRPYFSELKKIQKQYPELKELSMGTSSDYLVAAEEGATFVRLGTILFGQRMS